MEVTMMGEQPPVMGVHDTDRYVDFEVGDRSITAFYDPEAPEDVLLQGDVLQATGPSIQLESAGPSIR